MLSKDGKRIYIALPGRIAILVLILAPILPVAAVFGQQLSRAQLDAEVRDRAEEDFKLGRPPATVESLQILFGEDARKLGVTVREVDQVYQKSYSEAKAKQAWWKQFQPQAGWIAAVFLFLLFIFRDVIRDILTGSLKAIRNSAYARLAGSRWFRTAAIRKYRWAVIRKFEELRVPFRPDRPLEMRRIYVPLKARSGRDTNQIDTWRAISEYGRLMIVGAPGSGKSMLVRHLALLLAENGLLEPTHIVPVVLDLNRLNDSELGLEQMLVQVFQFNDFPHADQFVDLSLKQGTLMLLFDGLDEVNSQSRAAVVKRIQDFLAEFKETPAVITCRKAVYHQEFADYVQATLEIDEFSDNQIWRFLEAWKDDMPANKSIEQLIQTLRDRPRIMALARNPLLLTIIAYLYCDTEVVLPQSRTEFYEQATDVLLQQWKQDRNKFKLAQKRLVLQHLALFNQDRGADATGDKKSIGFQTVLTEVKALMPQLNLEEKDAQALVDEIVERSGLLLSIDGGERYQFAHLTLQEFFAASELRQTPEDLLNRFLKDSSTWRETVKLWCGLESDSTTVVKRVYQTDPVTAFECLADAQKIDATVADQIVAGFKARLAETGASGDAIRSAFAAVASDFRPRGRQVFEFLAAALGNTQDLSIKSAAGEALSLTNLPKAAQLLGGHLSQGAELRRSIVRMGDLSVDVLADASRSGSTEAVHDLRAIGTPRAAEALTSLLWSPSREVSVQAAWSLAALLRRDSVEEALSTYPLSRDQIQDRFRWIWKPFEEGSSTSLSTIVGRVAELIDESAAVRIIAGSEQPDERIVIPLCIDGLKSSVKIKMLWESSNNEVHLFNSAFGIESAQKNTEKPEERKKEIMVAVDRRSLEFANDQIIPAEKERLARAALDAVSTSEKWKALFLTLPFDLRLTLILRLIKGPEPTVTDWLNINKPVKFTFEKSAHQIVAMCLCTIITLLAAVGIWRNLNGWLLILSLTGLTWYSLCGLIGFLGYRDAASEAFLLSSLLGPIGGFRFLWKDLISDTLTARLVFCTLGAGFYLVAAGGWPFLSMYFASALFATNLSVVYRLLVSCFLIVGIATLSLRGLALDRMARNVLHGLLDQHSHGDTTDVVKDKKIGGNGKRTLMRLPVTILRRSH